jgi:predicted nucleic acid-binding Zn ribbon protein
MYELKKVDANEITAGMVDATVMIKKTWKVELRDDCKVCGGLLPNARYRSFCSAKCRNKFYNKKNQKNNTAWQRAQRDKKASEPSPDKVQCLICHRWYVQVCSHVWAIHKMTGRKYREYFELEVKRGVVPTWYRKSKGEQAIDNGTFKNLEAGEKFRFKKGGKVPVYKRSQITIERLRKNMEKLHTCMPTADGV